MSDQTMTNPAEGTGIEAFRNQITQMIGFAKEHTVTSKEAHSAALEAIDKSYGVEKGAEKLLRPHIQNAHKTWKGLTGDLKTVVDAVKEFRRILNPKIVAWQDEQEKKAREAEAKKQKELKAKEEEHQLDRAVTADEMGMPNIANEILEEEVVVPAPEVIPEVAKQEGLITKSRWTAEVKDDRALLQLVKHVAEHPEHVELLKPNQSALNRMAGALKRNMKIPGVEVKEEKKVQRAGKFTQ